MKLHQARQTGNVFTGYGEDYVSINGETIRSSVVVLSDRLRDWQPRSVDDLSPESMAELAELPVEILLIGTGRKLHFPHPRVLAPVRAAGIGLEVMDTPAACRTYNILRGEDRKVAAALLIGS